MDEPRSEVHLADAARLAFWKKRLLQKGGEVAGALEALMAGLEVDLETLRVAGKPEDDPVLRTRRFLDQIDRCIKRLGTDRFGRCTVCAAALDPRALDEAAWLERCPEHAQV